MSVPVTLRSQSTLPNTRMALSQNVLLVEHFVDLLQTTRSGSKVNLYAYIQTEMFYLSFSPLESQTTPTCTPVVSISSSSSGEFHKTGVICTATCIQSVHVMSHTLMYIVLVVKLYGSIDDSHILVFLVLVVCK